MWTCRLKTTWAFQYLPAIPTDTSTEKYGLGMEGAQVQIGPVHLPLAAFLSNHYINILREIFLINTTPSLPIILTIPTVVILAKFNWY